MKFKTILVDPPWEYRNKRTGGSMISGSESKYKTLSLEDICNLPINKIVDRDSVLFLWVTVPLLPEGLEVMKSWNFEYKTVIIWRKIMSLGLGYYFGGQIELLLMGIKGKVTAFRCQKPNFIQSKVRKHSEKPEKSYKLIEEASPEPRIELFARKKRRGWISIGYDIDGKDIKESIKLISKEEQMTIEEIKNKEYW